MSDSVCIEATTEQIYTQNCQSSTFFTGILSIIHFNKDTVLTDNYIVKSLNTVNINGKIYSGEILQLYRTDTLYIQKGVGIVGWKKNNNMYNLVRKYLQP